MNEEFLRKILWTFPEQDVIKTILNFYEDLQQKVEQLEKENKELKEENKRIFQNVNDDELLISNAMNYAELKKAEQKVEQLENIRKEASEYVRKHSNNLVEYLDVFETKELDNILNKGSEDSDS